MTLAAHSVPRWFTQCRYGMFVHANIASVPGFAPVHEYADWYWSHLEPKPDVVLHPTSPLPEVMAWHAEHFPGRAFDDFVPDLTFARFDAGTYADLAVAAGMRYVVHVSKHHDGFCWWDTALTDRTAVKQGPRRDVVGELAGATRDRGLVFGTYYSLLDWAHPSYPDQAAYVDAFMLPQLAELTERFRPAVLWGDGHWGHQGAHWRADRLVEAYYHAADRLGFEAAVNDRFFASHADFATYEYDVPEHAPDGAWELCRGLGYSFCWNRAERETDHLDARQVVAMLVETVAKGGNLLLNIGPHADGSIPELQVRILTGAGEWVRAHADAIHGSERFAVPGRDQHWYTVTPGAAANGRVRVNAIDLANASRPTFAALGPAAGRVHAVTIGGKAVDAQQTEDGLVVDAGSGARSDALATCYRVDFEPASDRPVAVRPKESTTGARAITRDGVHFATITEALRDAPPGSVVELATGRYTAAGGNFPLVIPAGVTLRGAGVGVAIDTGRSVAVTLAGDGATLANVTITGAAPGYMMIPPTCVTVVNASHAVVRDCRVESISVTGGEGHRISGNVVAGGNIWCLGAYDTTIDANFQHGLRWGAGIEVRGGHDNVVEANECRDDLCAIRIADSAGARIEGNRYETRWFGVHLEGATNARVRRNQAWHTMRAVSIERSAHALVEKNLAEHCDTGALVERDASGTRIVDNWFHDCRVGVVCWNDRDTTIDANAISAPRDHAIVTNAPVEITNTNELGGDVWRAPA